ncbi:MAG: hypothetical protein IAF02_17220, partial [Anaerolineae bacterium]|nr:hypothetical protein [Anaerolineae bacterium]
MRKHKPWRNPPWREHQQGEYQPRWMKHGPPWEKGDSASQHRPGCLFFRFLFFFGFVFMLLLAGMGFMALTVTRFFNGGVAETKTAVFV